ncbi:MAG: formate--tetrahydrofolate ligase [Bdellovibrionia bacterium]
MRLTDLEIAQGIKAAPIQTVAEALGVPFSEIRPFGHFKAKVSLEYLRRCNPQRQGKLILVTAMSPTPLGEGKTTTTVGLADALNQMGKKAMICLREPALGPVFGVKGGASGGGYAQLLPMEELNLHFTGDFAAIQSAHNLLAALIDNHIHHGNELGLDPRRLSWRRVLDLNDRALRKTHIGLGGPAHGVPREDGFDSVVASEVMAIVCLATSYEDLKQRLGKITVGQTFERQRVAVHQLGASGAMSVLLKEAMEPNLVQSLERTPAFVHGGPFANIAHGCNSVIATQGALKLSDYVVTEAGFGADLGLEKFIHIKCRKSGLEPAIAVVVATLRALKYHGGASLKEVTVQDRGALERGTENLKKHLANIQDHFGLPAVVALNPFDSDRPEEIRWLQAEIGRLGVSVVLATHWRDGGKGALELAQEVLHRLDEPQAPVRMLYADSDSLWDKIHCVAKKVYGATEVIAEKQVLSDLKSFESEGMGRFPVCLSKTQYSFSSDASQRGYPRAHRLSVREVKLASGAEFVTVFCGDTLSMPGLPRIPAALQMDLDSSGKITGLF